MSELQLPSAELYYRNQEKGESYKDLAEEFDCSITTIGRRVREFKELYDMGNYEAVLAIRVKRSSDKSKENIEFMKSDNYKADIEGRTDAKREEYRGIGVDGEEPEEYLKNANYDEGVALERAEDMRPVGVIRATERLNKKPWYSKLREWLREFFRGQ